MLGNLGKKRPNIPAEKLGTLRELMNKAVRDCLVTGYEPLVESLQLPDPDDGTCSLRLSEAAPRSSSRPT